MLNEALLWRLLVQLFSAVRLVHKRGMALRVVDIGHILITSGELVGLVVMCLLVSRVTRSSKAIYC